MEEVQAAKNSGCPGSSVADRSWSNSSSGLTDFLQRSLVGFGRKLHLHFDEEGCQYRGHLEDLNDLSSSEMLPAGSCCALASPACQLT